MGGYGVGAGGVWEMSKQENKERYSMSDLLSLPAVWDVCTDMYTCGIFTVKIDVQERWTPPVWLTETFFSLDINAKRALMLHSRQLEKLEYEASHPTSNSGGIQQPKVGYVRSHKHGRIHHEWSTTSEGHSDLLKIELRYISTMN